MPLVQGLGDGQGVLGGKAEAAVGLALQEGEVVQGRCALGGFLAGLLHRGRLALAAFDDVRGPALLPDPVAAAVRLLVVAGKVRIDPHALVTDRAAGEGPVQFPVGGGHELAPFRLALDQERQGRGLHPAAGGLAEAAEARVVTGERPGGVDADQPVRLGAAQGGVLQRPHLRFVTEFAEPLADGVQGHGLQPQPLDLLALHRPTGRLLEDVLEDEFALAAGVAAVDDHLHVLAADQFAQGVELCFGVRQHRQRKFLRQDGQVVQGPFLQGRVDLLGVGDAHQMTDGKGDDMVVAFEVGLGLGEPAGQRLDDVRGDARFLGDDQCLSHVGGPAGQTAREVRKVRSTSCQRSGWSR